MISKKNRIKYTVEILKDIAVKREGLFLDDFYKGTKHRYNWKCKFGHEFKKNVDNIMQGQWCSICSKGKSEKLCRFCFEELFQTKFPHRKDLDWLRNFNGNKMELDGYSEKLGIAFEYQGKQHTEYIPYFYHNNKEEFEQRLEDDKLKLELCKQNEIKLFIIPYDILSIDEIEDFILQKCKDFDIELKSKIDYSKYNFGPDDLLEEMIKIAESKGGKCLSTICINSQQKLKFFCIKHNYTWEAAPYSVKQGRWCKYDGYESSAKKNREKITIEDMKKLAIKYGGKCLSDEYLGQNKLLIWKCKNENHKPFKATPYSVKNNHCQCTICTKKERLTIEDMIIHAKNHGGKCITESLKEKGRTLVEFECTLYPKHPHFFKRASEIKHKHKLWCPLCEGGKIQKHSLENIKILAKQHNCECLSDNYKDVNEIMKWKCLKCTYEWESCFRQIQRKIKNKQKILCDKCNVLNKININF